MPLMPPVPPQQMYYYRQPMRHTYAAVLGGGEVSLAAMLAVGETQALALDFTDDYFNATTSHYGSAYVQDTGTPANNYDSHPYGLLTYTSPSAKMTLGPTGSLRFGAHNLCLRSEEFDNASWVKAQTTITANSVTAPDGLSTADTIVENSATNYHEVYQSVGSLIAGATYAFSVRLKPAGRTTVALYCSDGAGYYCDFTLTGAGSAGTATGLQSATITALDDGWYLCTIVRVAVNTTIIWGMVSGGYASLAGLNAAGAYAWGAHLRRTPSDSTYLSTTSAARYALPYERDSAGNLLGILVEEARTNLVTQSQAFDNAVWTELGISALSAGTEVAPDGTSTAETFAASTGSGAHAAYAGAFTVTTNANYALSVYAKKGTHRYVLMSQQRSANNTIAAVFDLDGGGSTASETYTGGTSGTIVHTKQELIGSGWYRLTLVGAAAGTAAFTFVGFASAATGNSFDTTGQVYFAAATTETAHFWGAQLEAGSFATSYIPTLGSTVSRAADNISLATSAFAHSATVNSAMIRYRPLGVATAMAALRWDDGTSNEVVSVGHDASANIGLTVTDGGAAQTAPLTSGTATANTWEKIAVSWKANDFLLSDNGATAASDTSGTLPTVTSLDIGPTLSGHISQILVIPVEKTAAEVEAMAT